MNSIRPGVGRPEDQQGEEKVAEADRVLVHHQVQEQPARSAPGAALLGVAAGSRKVRQVQAHDPGERLQVEGNALCLCVPLLLLLKLVPLLLLLKLFMGAVVLVVLMC